jgi:hypothetical protein
MKAKIEWQVIKNPVGPNEYLYCVVRKIRESEPMHGGNMETAGVFDREEDAVALEKELNQRGLCPAN